MDNITSSLLPARTMDNITSSLLPARTMDNIIDNITANIADNVTSKEHLDSGSELGNLTTALDTLLISLIVILMLSFGCSLEMSQIRSHLSRPSSIVLAMLLHFVVTPYVYYALVHVIDFNTYDHVSLVVLATSPAGGIGNMFVALADGDIALGYVHVLTIHQTLSPCNVLRKQNC